MDVLPPEAIRLGLPAGSKEDAILAAGRILEELGAVDIGYADAMLERERGMSTSVGEGFAIPHGTDESRELIHRTALSFAQFPAGVDWGEDRVYVCIGIAAVLFGWAIRPFTGLSGNSRAGTSSWPGAA